MLIFHFIHFAYYCSQLMLMKKKVRIIIMRIMVRNDMAMSTGSTTECHQHQKSTKSFQLSYSIGLENSFSSWHKTTASISTLMTQRDLQLTSCTILNPKSDKSVDGYDWPVWVQVQYRGYNIFRQITQIIAAAEQVLTCWDTTPKHSA